MSTFGEINEPSSRTAWEDWDDDHSENLAELRLEKAVKIPEDIDTFIILEGRYLYDCVKTNHDLELVNSSSDINLRIFKTKKMNNYVCVIRDYNLVFSSEIINLLINYFTISTDVIAILTKPLVEYQVSEPVTKDYVIRSLSTSKQSSKYLDISFPKLEQPNFISGVSAGVLGWREIDDMPVIAIVCYIAHPEEQQIQELNVFLEKLQVIPHLGKAHQNKLMNSNLYI